MKNWRPFTSTYLVDQMGRELAMRARKVMHKTFHRPEVDVAIPLCHNPRDEKENHQAHTGTHRADRRVGTLNVCLMYGSPSDRSSKDRGD